MAKRTREEGKDYVLKMAKEHDVKFIRLWFTDILGILKSFAITVEELELALTEGMGFDGSSIEGFARIDESDMVAMPDPDSFQLLPWRPREHRAVARMFCDILRPGGQPFEGDPRYVLKQNLKRAADLGYTYYVGPELEYFYFKNSDGTVALDHGAISTSSRWIWLPTCAGRPCLPWRSLVSASNILTMRWRPASTR